MKKLLGDTKLTWKKEPEQSVDHKNPLKIIPILMASTSISVIAAYLIKIEVPSSLGGFLILDLVDHLIAWMVCSLLGTLTGVLLYNFVTPVAERKEEDSDTQKEVKSVPVLYKEETICLSLKNKEKSDVINEMIKMLTKDGVLNNPHVFMAQILKRESISSTAHGGGIAIPNAKSSAVNTSRVAVGFSKEGITYDSIDGKPVHIIFMFAVREDEYETHLSLLSDLSQKLMEPVFIERLNQCATKKEVAALLSKNRNE